MKVLVLCYEYPPIGGGGGRVAAQVARELAARGHEVQVQTSGMRHLPRREVRQGVTIFRAESFRQREDTCSVFEMGLYLLTSFWPAWRLIRRERPDVLHVHFAVPTGVLAWILHRLTGVPYVLTAHLGDVPGGVPEQTAHLFRLVDPLARRIWRDAAGVTAVSSFVADLARQAYGVRPEVILNGLPPKPARPLSPADATTRLIFVGRLSVQKNPVLAVEALALVRDLPWTLEVVGDGPLGPEMRAAVQKHELTEKITFHGWLEGDRTGALMAASEVLLMTSLHEGLPMVAVEALREGLAIVGSAIGGLRDVINDGENGFLCAQTPEAFAEKLRVVIADASRRQAMREASLRLAAGFDLARSVDAYEAALRL